MSKHKYTGPQFSPLPLFLIMIFPLILLIHAGKVHKGRVSNHSGRIGIRTDWERTITRVYLDSPAEKAGLQVSDKIMLVDGTHKGSIIGTPETSVNLQIKRGEGVMEFNIVRAPSCEISRKWQRY